MIATLRQRWRRCNQREQLLLAVCAATLLLFFSHQLLLSPLNDWRQQQQQHRDRAQRDLQWMQSRQPQIEALQRQQPQALTETLLQLLQRSASEMNVQLAIAKNGTLTLPPQPFPPLLAWLTQLELGYGIQASQLSLQAGPDGQLSGELVLTHD